MTGRWQTGAGVERDTVLQHNTVLLAGTEHPAFVPPRLLNKKICVDPALNLNDLSSFRGKKRLTLRATRSEESKTNNKRDETERSNCKCKHKNTLRPHETV